MLNDPLAPQIRQNSMLSTFVQMYFYQCQFNFHCILSSHCVENASFVAVFVVSVLFRCFLFFVCVRHHNQSIVRFLFTVWFLFDGILCSKLPEAHFDRQHVHPLDCWSCRARGWPKRKSRTIHLICYICCLCSNTNIHVIRNRMRATHKWWSMSFNEKR